MTKAITWCNTHPVITLAMAPVVAFWAAEAVELMLVSCGYWQ